MKSSKSKKKYKALILDLDGTTIPSSKHGMPTEKVREAIRKASKILTVSIATSRPAFVSLHILDHLSINAPSIITSGAQIYDPVAKKMLKETFMTRSSIKEVRSVFEKLGVDGVVNEGKEDLTFSSYTYERPLQIFTDAMTKARADKVFDDLSKIPDIHLHKATSWKNGLATIVIGHVEATKQHGVFEVAKILNIDTHDMIGVGDGYNDFPLLMACGLKVAMGNAVPDLKAIADYVAPTVDEDGVVDVIERFVL